MATIAPEPARARPVYSIEDTQLIKNAVLAYIRANEDSPETIKYSNLYHRLGRLR